ncbi:hypothetical protein GH865_07350 [Rhodocyclus tenuis]|uniref:flagellar hook-length control protein FliK n=1 Tax=Rhodocyclus gracilis TaxID=2929842 RepID=UPI001298AD7E|nr:hypothetical protein [Rhodocyclus gracilis]
MIPADVISRMQVSTSDSSARPQVVARDVSDKLTTIAPGQRLLAEILAVLPNGAYRAVINQREITLALPFAAKTGDTLELEAVESDGKVTLAVVGNKSGPANGEAVSTTLSRTGQFITDLLNTPRQNRGEAGALSLNNGAPITNTPPKDAADLLPQLKQAITQSGMFYEAHQRGWLEGRVDTAELLQEPQGRLSTTQNANERASAQAGAETEANANTATTSAQTKPTETNNDARSTPQAGSSDTSGSKAATATGANAPMLAPETLPVVRQQLESLAAQQFIWQGQVWPGQDMRWQISEEEPRQDSEGGGDGSDAPEWRTQMRLTLPNLGEIDARIGLRGNGIRLDIEAGDEQTQALLRSAMSELRVQLDNAGLSLSAFGVTPIAEPPPASPDDAQQDA